MDVELDLVTLHCLALVQDEVAGKHVQAELAPLTIEPLHGYVDCKSIEPCTGHQHLDLRPVGGVQGEQGGDQGSVESSCLTSHSTGPVTH